MSAKAGRLLAFLLLTRLLPSSLVVASCVTPTDPILAQAVVGGPWAEKHVPAHLRHMLMCESGCNDGAAFPFLYLALYLTTNRDNHGKAIAEWFYDAWAYQIIFGTILGALIGWAARKLMRFSERHRLVDRESFVAQYVSLAIASMGVNVLLGSDDLLAAFACGTAFAWDGWFTRQTEDSNFSSIVDLLFNVATFIYIGALMPFRQFAGGPDNEPNTLNIWRLFVLAICVLLTKRLPIVIMLWRWIPDIKTFREAVFAGHFGPIGVGAIFIATLARTRLPEEVASPPETSNDILALTVQPIIFFFVLCSIIIHGLTIPFFAFSKRATTMTRTWSRNPSFMDRDNEPSWVNKFRRNKTGESIAGEEGNMTEIERVLNAQLGKIGRGAIGGEAEQELRRESTDPEKDSSTARGGEGDESDQSRVGLYNSRTEREMREAHDDYEEDHEMEREDPMSEWGGDDTIEMRRYRQKLQEKKELEYAELRRKQQDADERSKKSSDERQRDSQESDLGVPSGMAGDEDEERGPMDRDLNAKTVDSDADEDKDDRRDMEREHDALIKSREGENKYPQSNAWVEGHQLVIEHQASKSSEAECVVIPLTDEERETIGQAENPALAWSQAHAKKIEFHLGLDDVHEWSKDTAANHLMHHRIPHRYNEYLSRRGRRRQSVSDSKEERDRRSQIYADTLKWAATRRDDEDEAAPGKSMQQAASQPAPRKKARRPASPEEEEAPISGWLASPGGYTKQKKPKRHTSPPGSASPNRNKFKPGSGQIKQFISRPSATDSRRMTLRKKVCTGELSLCKASRLGGEESFEEVDSSSMPRTSSAGGLAESGRRSMQSSKSSSTFLQLPRTSTTESSRSSDGADNRRGMNSKSSSVQWLDIGDSSHNHQSTSTPLQTISRPSSPSRDRDRTQTPRTQSRNSSPTRHPERHRNERLLLKKEESFDSVGGPDSVNKGKRRSRFANLLSHISTPSSPTSSSALRSSRMNNDEGHDNGEDANEDSRSTHPLRHQLAVPPASTNQSERGILSFPSSRSASTKDNSNDASTDPTPIPGVTFNL